MKTTMAMVACMVLGATSAGATEIAGKWGIGAAVFGGGGELSLIRGHSARSAWLFDVFISQRSDELKAESILPSSPTVTQDLGALTFVAGPGFRRFSRPSEAFSPYWDIRVRGSYARSRGETPSTQDIDTRTDSGVQGEFSFGLEYFTSWHFSVAAHTGLARAAFVHSTQEQATPTFNVRFTDDTVSSSIGLSPVLYVRAYF
jgi:hypothetical protein